MGNESCQNGVLCTTAGSAQYLVERRADTVQRTGLPYASRVCEACLVAELRRAGRDTSIKVTVVQRLDT